MYNPIRYRSFFSGTIQTLRCIRRHALIASFSSAAFYVLYRCSDAVLSHINQNIFFTIMAILVCATIISTGAILLLDSQDLLSFYYHENKRLKAYPQALNVPKISSDEFAQELDDMIEHYNQIVQSIEHSKRCISQHRAQIKHLKAELHDTLLSESIDYREYLQDQYQQNHHS